jgi:hypothetical protein
MRRRSGRRRFLVPLVIEELERFSDLVVEGCGGHLVLLSSKKNPRARRVSTVSGGEANPGASFSG